MIKARSIWPVADVELSIEDDIFVLHDAVSKGCYTNGWVSSGSIQLNHEEAYSLIGSLKAAIAESKQWDEQMIKDLAKNQ